VRFYDRVRDLTLELAGIESVNGGGGEDRLLERAYVMLSGLGGPGRLRVFRGAGEDGRPAFVLAHLGGRDRRAVLLFGHVDTVGIEDYGALSEFALDPPDLTRRVADGALGPDLARVAAGGDWLFGRGVLDMKSGLAAGIAWLEAALEDPAAGHLLLGLTADEEGGSRGMRALTAFLAPYLAEEGLELAGAVNTDATGPLRGARHGPERFLYTGSIGKLLPCALVLGRPSHAGEPDAGLDPNLLLAEITRRVVYARDLGEQVGAEEFAPPVALLARDQKTGYDVQTARSAVAAYNVLYARRSPGEILARFASVARLAAREAHERRAAALGGMAVPPVLTLQDVLGRLDRGAEHALRAALAGTLGQGAGPIERIAAATRIAESALGGEPAVVLFFGAGPIVPVASSRSARPVLERAVARVAAPAEQYTVRQFFPLISDLSLLGGPQGGPDAAFTANEPRSALFGADPASPLTSDALFMVGPHGEGAHRIDERVYTPYSFERLPELLAAICRELWLRPGRPAGEEA